MWGIMAGVIRLVVSRDIGFNAWCAGGTWGSGQRRLEQDGAG